MVRPKRTANGEGNAYLDEQGYYNFRISYVDPITQKRKRKNFKSKISLKAAKAKAENFLNGLKAETPKPHSDDTLLEWLEHWITVYKANTVKKNTLIRYKSLIDTTIKPFPIGNVKIKEVTAVQLQEHCNFLLTSGGNKKKGLATATVEHARKLLRNALNLAVDEDLIARNVAERTKAIRIERKNMRVLDHDEAKRLLEVAKEEGEIPYIVIMLALHTGMRIGEIFGLRWKDIDFSAKVLAVRNSVVMVNSGAIFQESGKTSNAIRRIQFSEELRNALAEHAAWQHMVIHQLPNIWHKSDFVVNHKNGSFCDPGYFSERVFKRLLKAACITTDVRFHDLRHTHATLLLADGVNPKVVSERLGHSNIRITLDTYAHVLPTMQEEAVKSIEKILGK